MTVWCIKAKIVGLGSVTPEVMLLNILFYVFLPFDQL